MLYGDDMETFERVQDLLEEALEVIITVIILLKQEQGVQEKLFFKRIRNILRLVLRQHWPANVCTKNSRPTGVTVH